MDKTDLKQAVSHIVMSDDMAQRIRSNLRQTNAGKRTASKWYRRTPVVAVVLAICVLTVSAAATCTYLFHNPTILKDHDALNAVIEENNNTATGRPEAVVYQAPNSRSTFSLERVIDDYTFKSRGWTSEDTMYGSIRSDDAWSFMEVTDAEGPLRARSIFSEAGAVKEEFTAEDPALLQERMRGDLSIDFSGLNTAFAYIPDANLLYTITDRNGTDAGLYCDALYAGPTEGSYFTIEYTYEPDADNQAYGAPYITESDYDEAYAYTNAHSVEFVITTYGDCSWAECTTAHGTFCLYGGYLSTETMETILDYIGMGNPS